MKEDVRYFDEEKNCIIYYIPIYYTKWWPNLDGLLDYIVKY